MLAPDVPDIEGLGCTHLYLRTRDSDVLQVTFDDGTQEGIFRAISKGVERLGEEYSSSFRFSVAL